MVTVADRQAFHRPLLSTVTQLRINLNWRRSNDTGWCMISATTKLLVFLRYNKISHYSEINKRPRDRTGGHTRVNERARNRQSEAAGRPKCAGVTAGRDWRCPGMPGTLVYTNQHIEVHLTAVNKYKHLSWFQINNYHTIAVKPRLHDTTATGCIV